MPKAVEVVGGVVLGAADAQQLLQQYLQEVRKEQATALSPRSSSDAYASLHSSTSIDTHGQSSDFAYVGFESNLCCVTLSYARVLFRRWK